MALPSVERIIDATKTKMNIILLVTNIFLVASLAFATIVSAAQFDRTERDFLRQASLKNRDEPTPCALATPDVYYLFQALGMADTSMFHPVKRETWIREIENAMCHASYGDTDIGTAHEEYDYAKRMQTLAFLFNADELKPPPSLAKFTEDYNAITAAAAESAGVTDPPLKKTQDHIWAAAGELAMVHYMCNITESTERNGQFNSKLYGDLVERVSRAYMNAMPAFFRLATSGKYPTELVPTSEHPYERTCMEENHPFRSDVTPAQCPWIETIRRELAAAGTVAQSGLAVGLHTVKAPTADPPANGAVDCESVDDQGAKTCDRCGDQKMCREAADNPEIDKGLFYRESMPRVDAMLYRLLLLTVVGHYDRKYNDHDCFRNHEKDVDSVQLCTKIYGAVGHGDIPDWPSDRLPTLTGLRNFEIGVEYEFGVEDRTPGYLERMATMITWKHRYRDGSPSDTSLPLSTGFQRYEAGTAPDTTVYGYDARPQVRTCRMEAADYNNYAPPPPAPDWDYHLNLRPPPPSAPGTPMMPLSSAVQQAVIHSCAQNMQYGLFDQARLLGLPDTVGPFVTEPRDPTQYTFAWIYDTFEKDYFENPVNSNAHKRDAMYRLRMYTGYELALAGLWMTLVGASFGYFIAFGAVPAIFTLWSRVPFLGIRMQNGGQLTLFRPPMNRDWIAIMASIAGLFSAFWAIAVLPYEGPHYPMTDECHDFYNAPSDGNQAHGGVYVTSLQYSDSAVSAKATPGWILLIVVVFTWFADVGLKPIAIASDNTLSEMQKADEKTFEQYNFTNTFTMLVLGAGGIGFAVGTAIMQGNKWKDLSEMDIEVQPTAANWLAVEVRTATVTAVFYGLATGMTGQRWVLDDLTPQIRVLYYTVLVGVTFVPSLARYQLMNDKGLWDKLINEEEHREQRDLLYVQLGFAVLTSVVAFAGGLFMCTKEIRVATRATLARRAAANAASRNLRAITRAAEDEVRAAQQAKEEATMRKQTRAAERSRAKAAEARANAEKVRDFQREADAQAAQGARSWAGEDGSGAYLPMIRITA